MVSKTSRRRFAVVAVLFLALGSCATDGEPTTDAAEEFRSRCRSAVDADACNGIADFNDGTIFQSCVWVDWVRAEVDPQTGACSFSEAEPRCEVTYGGSEGCPGPGTLFSVGCEEPVDQLPLSRPSDEATLVGFARHCFPTDTVEQCSVEDGVASPPECACLCDSGFPGG